MGDQDGLIRYSIDLSQTFLISIFSIREINHIHRRRSHIPTPALGSP